MKIDDPYRLARPLISYAVLTEKRHLTPKVSLALEHLEQATMAGETFHSPLAFEAYVTFTLVLTSTSHKRPDQTREKEQHWFCKVVFTYLLWKL